MFSNFFFENLPVYEIMWKNIVEPGRPHMTMWRMRIGILDTKGYRYTLRIRITYCLLRYNNGCTNAPQYYVIRTLPVMLHLS